MTNKEQKASPAKDSKHEERHEQEDAAFSSSKGSFLTKLAVFGDSPWALFASFLLLVLAVGVSLWMDHQQAISSHGGVSSTTTTSASTPARPVTTHQTRHSHKKSNNTTTTTNPAEDFEEKYQALGPIPDIDPPRVYKIDEDSIESIHEAYQKDGVVAVRGLIPTDLLDRLDQESQRLMEMEEQQQGNNNKKKPKRHPNPDQPPKKYSGGGGKKKQFHTQRTCTAFLEPPTMMMMEEESKAGGGQQLSLVNASAFLEVAVLSQVPKFSSQLMMPELQQQENETVRMLRDIFFSKDEEEFICGWHVDDFGFWPATAESPGVNAWIALDDMPVQGGGGFALAVGSHNAPWKEEAHYVTGATTTFPPEGYQSAEDLFQNRTGKGTCNIQTTAPHLYRRMEETKRIYDLQKGDVIFHQRWLFHRTVAFERDYVKQHNNNEQPLLYRRYSVRFAPGAARIPPGYGTELSVLWDENNGNRTADQVSEMDGPWYPRVWPSPSMEELHKLKDLIGNKFPVAEERKHERRREMSPYLKQAAKRAAKNQQ